MKGKDIRCRVLVGGVLKDNKGINLPGAAVSVPTLTGKDIEDLAFGQELGVDYVALSFVRSAKDVRQARAHVEKLGTPLIAKIEKPQAVEHLDAIAEASDGIMIARGDLGVEMPLEQLPGIQKAAVTAANARGRAGDRRHRDAREHDQQPPAHARRGVRRGQRDLRRRRRGDALGRDRLRASTRSRRSG